MKMLEGKVAAVTGAASGLGRAMALAFAGEGMHAALADIDEPGLKSTLNEVQGRGVRAFAMRVDVSRYQEVESFCSKAIAQFGATHVVCNNAGVSPLGAVWENTLADWQWILGVNLWGVINGVRDVARDVVPAVKEERFYVHTRPRIKGAIRARMEDILDERAPRNPLAL